MSLTFSPQKKSPLRSAMGVTGVSLLHVAIVAALIQGLAYRGSLKHQDFEPMKYTPDTKKVEVEPPPPIKFDPKPFDPTKVVPPVPPIKIDGPVIIEKTLPTTSAGDPPVGNTDARNDTGLRTGQVDKTGSQSTMKKVDVVLDCNNYATVQAMLADRLPVVADREDFASRGIDRFDMTMDVVLGPKGEIKSVQVGQSSNAFAGQAMRATVLNAMHKLSCVGQGHDVAMQVPLNFKLIE
jgi:hypothetical protein